jgi:hypothetical protein
MQLRRAAVEAALEKAQPLLRRSFTGAQQLGMAALLRELQAHEPELDTFLDPELALLLAEEEAVRADLRAAAVDIELMVDGLRGLLRAVYRLKGRLADESLVRRLEDVLTVEKYDFAALKAVFEQALLTWGTDKQS